MQLCQFVCLAVGVSTFLCFGFCNYFVIAEHHQSSSSASSHDQQSSEAAGAKTPPQVDSRGHPSSSSTASNGAGGDSPSAAYGYPAGHPHSGNSSSDTDQSQYADDLVVL